MMGDFDKKVLKINFCGFWGSFKKDNNLFYNILSKYFRVEISETPDFIICSNRGKPFEYMKYDCVRIMFMGENLSPDFTVFDYVIGFDYIDFQDRYFRLPFAFYSDEGKPWVPETLTKEQAQNILKSKNHFCNFIYGHPSSNSARENLFNALNRYKTVVSPGSYLNNIGNNGCNWSEKYEYLKLSKFTIAGDSINYPGFVTEKVIQPFQQHSIPIYFGSPRINEDINEKAFVWCKTNDDAGIKEMLEQVEYLDKNDDAYIKMLMEYPLISKNMLDLKYAALEEFLLNIFSQNPQQAYRRVKFFCAELHESYLKKFMNKHKNSGIMDKLKALLK